MIRKGPWKGYEGRIKEADNKSVRLELNCRCKIITVPRIDVTGDNETEIE